MTIIELPHMADPKGCRMPCYVQCPPEECDCLISTVHRPPPMAHFFEMKAFRVKLRRGPDWKVKPESECLDGNVYYLQSGWEIDEGIYKGERAWIGYRDNNFPPSAPGWVASGDLEEIPLSMCSNVVRQAL